MFPQWILLLLLVINFKKSTFITRCHLLLLKLIMDKISDTSTEHITWWTELQLQRSLIAWTGLGLEAEGCSCRSPEDEEISRRASSARRRQLLAVAQPSRSPPPPPSHDSRVKVEVRELGIGVDTAPMHVLVHEYNASQEDSASCNAIWAIFFPWAVSKSAHTYQILVSNPIRIQICYSMTWIRIHGVSKLYPYPRNIGYAIRDPAVSTHRSWRRVTDLQM